jgi:hypothetical protein
MNLLLLLGGLAFIICTLKKYSSEQSTKEVNIILMLRELGK